MGDGVKAAGKAALRLGIGLCLALTPLSVRAAEGVLLGVSGDVDVTSYGARQPAKTALRLRTGDTVQSLGGEASGMLEDGRMFRVAQNETYTVPGDRASGPAGVLASRLMDALRKIASRGRAPAGGAAEPEERALRLLYPHNASVLPGGVRFEWEPPEEVDRVEITVKSPSPVYKQTFAAGAGESGAFLPRKAPPLTPGVRYYWKVQGTRADTGEVRSSDLAWFSVLKPDVVREMQASMDVVDGMDFFPEPDRDVLRASLLISYGLYHRAEPLLKKGLERFPEDRGLKELLGGLYREMKRPRAAEKVL